MATFTLLITDDAHAGLQFAKAVVAAGHQLTTVFFYADAVSTANTLVPLVGGEPHLGQQWSDFAQEQGLELAVCVAAAERRGILDDELAAEHQLPASLKAPYRQAGLGELVNATMTADRTVQW